MNELMQSHKRRYRLFKGLHCTFEINYLSGSPEEPLSIEVKWEPDVPEPRGKVLKKYRAARHAFFDEFAEKIDGSILAMDAFE
jgi:hypothetical protein